MALTAQNPYVGPRSFLPGERLYGRDRESAELLDLLISQRIVLLYSPSGAGKSSLINATIINEMINQGFNVLPVVRVNQTLPDGIGLDSSFNRYVYSALLSMESELTEFKQLSNEQLYELSISAYLNEHMGERAVAHSEAFDEAPPLLLVFDQLEEIITLDPTDRTAKQEFFRQVGDALQDQNIWALFVIREDYIAALDPYLRFVPTRLSNRFRLDLLEARGAI